MYFSLTSLLILINSRKKKVSLSTFWWFYDHILDFWFIYFFLHLSIYSDTGLYFSAFCFLNDKQVSLLVYTTSYFKRVDMANHFFQGNYLIIRQTTRNSFKWCLFFLTINMMIFYQSSRWKKKLKYTPFPFPC